MSFEWRWDRQKSYLEMSVRCFLAACGPAFAYSPRCAPGYSAAIGFRWAVSSEFSSGRAQGNFRSLMGFSRRSVILRDNLWYKNQYDWRFFLRTILASAHRRRRALTFWHQKVTKNAGWKFIHCLIWFLSVFMRASPFSFKAGAMARTVQSEKFIRPVLSRTVIRCYGLAIRKCMMPHSAH